MSNQFGTNQNPPWVRQEFGAPNSAANMLQPNVTYPFTQAQNQFGQQITPGATMQAPGSGLLPQPGIALPTSLSAITVAQVNPVSYPVKSQGAGNANAVQSPVNNMKQKIFTGTVTKMHDTFGFVDEEVFFQTSCVKGLPPKVGDKVLVEASFNANMPFKWNATRVISLHDNSANHQPMSVQQMQQQQQQQEQNRLKAIQQHALGLMGAAPPPLMNSNNPSLNAGIGGGQGLLNNPPGPPPLMKFQSSGVYNASNRSGMNTGPGLLGDPRPPQRLVGPGPGMNDHRGSMAGMQGQESQREKERRERERRERRAERRKRSRSPPPPKRSHSPPPKRSRSPVKRRIVRPPPRYVVQVPKILLDVTEASVMALKSKYSNLYIPSDFFHTSFPWVDNFPLSRPFTLGQSCAYHIMHKDVPTLEPVDCTEPSDVDYLFSAKVMLVASPPVEELYKKSCCLAEDLPDAYDSAQHPTRLLQFLVGTRGKNEPMAIGGAWSPTLDGPNPQANPQVLIKTAIRTTKALTGIDLSSCTQWYRFIEIRYFRPESKHKDRLQPARVETVVIFLPDIWNCNPTHLEWTSLQAAYQKQLQQRLNPEAASQQEEEEEGEMDTGEEKTEPSHFSTLDPKSMKVGDLRKELQLRMISPKGLKSQLISRLSKALKTEEEEEEESKNKEKKAAEIAEAAKIVEEQMKEEKLKDEEKSEATKKEDEETQRKEKRERGQLERRYKLPDSPSIVVHPSATAKSGKFDCTVMSLSVLLDYRPEDNKEHSFEVSLFAELFNEMLMRDFGFKIYCAIAQAPPKKEEEKKVEEKKKDDKKDEKKEKDDKKDEKKEKDDKDKKDSDKKEVKKEEKTDDKKSSNRESSPKRRKTEDKKEETKDDNKDKEEDRKSDKADKDKEEKRKRKEDEKKKTVNRDLLLAFSYFDLNHCGHLTDADTEDIIHTLGLKLSRAQIKKLVQKVLHHESFKYRKLTDEKVNEKGEVIEDKECEGIKLEPQQLARGNKESLRKLLELSGMKKEVTVNAASQDTGENPNFVTYKGSILDVESLMQKLDRSDKSRAVLEKDLMSATDELKTAKSGVAETEKKNSKLSKEVDKLKTDLEEATKSKKTAEASKDEFQRLATTSKTHLVKALNAMDTLLAPKDSEVKKEATSDVKQDEKKASK